MSNSHPAPAAVVGVDGSSAGEVARSHAARTGGMPECGRQRRRRRNTLGASAIGSTARALDTAVSRRRTGQGFRPPGSPGLCTAGWPDSMRPGCSPRSRR